MIDFHYWLPFAKQFASPRDPDRILQGTSALEVAEDILGPFLESNKYRSGRYSIGVENLWTNQRTVFRFEYDAKKASLEIVETRPWHRKRKTKTQELCPSG